MSVDVEDQATIDAAKSSVESKVESDGLNLLINNAGLLVRMGLEDVTRETMSKCYEINAIGPLMMAKVSLFPCLFVKPQIKQVCCSQANIEMLYTYCFCSCCSLLYCVKSDFIKSFCSIYM